MQTCQRISALVIGTLLALAVTTQAQEQPAAAVPERPSWPGMTPTGAVLLPNGWTLQPAGRQIPVGDLPILIAECPPPPSWPSSTPAGVNMKSLRSTPTARPSPALPSPKLTAASSGHPTANASTSAAGSTASSTASNTPTAISPIARSSPSTPIPAPPTPRPELPEDEPLPRPQRGSREAAGAIAGLALSPDGKTLWAANAFGHKLERVDAETGQLLGTLDLGPDSYPYALALDTHSGKRLYVSLWGQARVAVVDIQQARRSSLATSRPRNTPTKWSSHATARYLFIANANRNTVTVYDTVNEASRSKPSTPPSPPRPRPAARPTVWP